MSPRRGLERHQRNVDNFTPERCATVPIAVPRSTSPQSLAQNSLGCPATA